MRQKTILIAGLCAGWLATPTWSAPSSRGNPLVQRDATYEQNLRWEASTDKTITPSKVLRWMRGLRDSAVFSGPSPAEFQPIVNVYNSRVRVLATIAYKF
jgi:hypothetical protein